MERTEARPRWIVIFEDAQQLEQVIDQGSTITIEPGAHIRATKRGQLIVHRGSKIIAEGTADKPITFSVRL